MVATSHPFAVAQQFHRAGDFPRAERHYRSALSDDAPPNPELLFMLGAACQAQGKLDEAIPFLRQAIQLKPNYGEALHNLGVALAQQRQLAEACVVFRRAFQARPQTNESLVDLGKLYSELGLFDEAACCFDEALSVRESPELHNLLAHVLIQRGSRQDAVVHFDEALRLEPRYHVAHSNLLLTFSHDPEKDRSSLFAEHLWWNRLHGQGVSCRPTFANIPDPNRRIRIGYVSPDFRCHAIMPFLEPLLGAHDLEKVEVFAYAELQTPDAVTARLQAYVRAWRYTHGWSDAEVATQIRSDGIDILVDLAGHTAQHRLRVFTHKPAPVQVTYLGYAGTTGLTTIDYRLTDAIGDPAGEAHVYTEELVRLPRCFSCYAPPTEAPKISPLPAGEGNSITFASTHKLIKLNDAVLNLWGRLLRAVPNSCLLIVRHTLTRHAKDRLRRVLETHGIAPERLELRQVLEGPRDFLESYRSIDVLLDVFPWCGHAMTCEALWMGVPVITLRGDRFAGRMGASLLTQLGLTELIASDQEEYIAIAAQLALDRPRLAHLRATLRERVRSSPLCDAKRFTRELEDAYRWMWRRWCAKQHAAECVNNESTNGKPLEAEMPVAAV